MLILKDTSPEITKVAMEIIAGCLFLGPSTPYQDETGSWVLDSDKNCFAKVEGDRVILRARRPHETFPMVMASLETFLAVRWPLLFRQTHEPF